jgi:F0F1-type ATP synthase alpha subunit
MKSTLKSIELDILQSADDEMYLKVKEKLVKLYDHEKSEEIVKNIKRAKNLEKKFKAVVSETVDEVRKRGLEIYG